jgi:hypothetical protein
MPGIKPIDRSSDQIHRIARKPSVLAWTLFCRVTLAGEQVRSNDPGARMLQAGFAPDLILKTIVKSGVQFQCQLHHLIAPEKAGTPDDMARAMTASRNENPRFVGR